MNDRGRRVARLSYSFSHEHSLSDMCACTVKLMHSFIHVNASGQILVHSSALLGNSKSGKCCGNSSQVALTPSAISTNLLSTRSLHFTVNGSVLDCSPKLDQQLPELGIGELVPVTKTSNVQTSINRRHEFDDVVPGAKGVA